MTDEELKERVSEAMESRPKRHNLEPFKDSSRTRKLRMWLNIIFIVLAAIGLLVYFKSDHEAGKWVLLVSLVFKFVELILRIFKI